jgi:hypothetical protein
VFDDLLRQCPEHAAEITKVMAELAQDFPALAS